MERDENGEMTLEDTDLYLFTDRNGVFVLSEMDKGEYVFDTKENGVWVMNILVITDSNRYDRIGMVEGEKSISDDFLPYPYMRKRLKFIKIIAISFFIQPPPHKSCPRKHWQ